MNLRQLPGKIYDLAISETSYLSPEAQARRLDDIKNNPNILRKSGALLVHLATGAVGRERLFSLFSYPYERKGYEVIGIGTTATALRSMNGKVSKIVRMPGRNHREDLTDVAGKTEELISINQQFHPNETTPTSVEILPSPILGSKVIILCQPYIPRFSGSDSLELRNAIGEFSERSLDEMAPLGYLPDVLGSNNVYPSSPDEIALVDTVSINEDSSPTVFRQCLSLLRSMAKNKQLPR